MSPLPLGVEVLDNLLNLLLCVYNDGPVTNLKCLFGPHRGRRFDEGSKVSRLVYFVTSTFEGRVPSTSRSQTRTCLFNSQTDSGTHSYTRDEHNQVGGYDESHVNESVS